MPEIRKHIAIIFSDIAGYTTLMGSDEDRAFELLRKNREIHKVLVKEHGGTLIKEMGDGMLISFDLASGAVRCAQAIQREAKKQQIPLKIGIHEGEMIFDGNDILGDGVNIASRLQDASMEGCISISDSVFRDIKNKAGITTRFIKEMHLKNVDEPVKVYQVICNEEPESTPFSAYIEEPSGIRKSIIVLPFVNISPDPEQEYFSDGLTEEIITDLSHIHDLLVISRSSAMTFKGSKLTIREIAKKVNVQYVLEGSVRKAGNNLRITAQLIDAEKDVHLWAEKYTGVLEDVFDIQENVSGLIVESLRFRLNRHEKEQLKDRPIDNVAAYECYLKSKENIFSFTVEGIQRAIAYLKKGLEIIGENSILYGGMGVACFQLVNLGYKHDEFLKKARDYAFKAFNLDPESPQGNAVIGYTSLLDGDIKNAIFHLKKSMISDPSDADTTGWLGFFYAIVGRIEEAKRLAKKSLTMDPLNPAWLLLNSAINFLAGDFKYAKKISINYYDLAPDQPVNQFWYSLTLAYNYNITESITILDKLNLTTDTDDAWINLCKLLKHTLKGDKESLNLLLAGNIYRTCRRDQQLSYHTACFYSYLNEKEPALDWLENATERGFINYSLLNEYDPFLENIRNEPRFKKLMEKVKYEWENFEV
jgi:adenylate cyclase